MLIGIDAHNLESKRTGVGRYLFNLLREWSRLVNGQWPLGAGDLKFRLYFKDVIPDDIPKSDFFEYKLLKVGSNAKFTHWNLPRAAKKDKVDILFCPGYISPICFKGKIALALHDIIYEAHPDWFNWPGPADRILLKWVSKVSARKARIIFVPSEFTRQEVLKYYRVPSSKIYLAPLSVDPNLLSDSGVYGVEEIAEIKNKFGVKSKFIFYVGSIFQRRHLKEVIAAFEALIKEYPNYQFLLSGRDYTANQTINSLAKELNLRSGKTAILRVDFIGDSELRLLYGACTFFIWLSDYEGFGLPPLEAMSCGAPVITSDAASLKEVAGKAALLIKNNSDAREIYQAMKKIASDEIFRQELIVKGREQVAEFSWERCAKKTLETLLSI